MNADYIFLRLCNKTIKNNNNTMKIIFLANFPSKLDGGVQGRFINLAMLLHNRGHQVEVIVSDFDHASKKHRVKLDNKYPFKLTYLHETGYPNNLHPRRLWSHYIWGLNVERYLKRLSLKPDVVYAALPTFTAGRLAGKWCNENGVKYIVDVQDLWPEAFQVAFKNPIIQLAFKPMEWIANAAYRAADNVIGVSDTYRDRALLVNSKVKDGLTVYLGNDGEKFDSARKYFVQRKPDDEFWIAYIGTMGYSYDLHCAIDAIKKAEETCKLNKKIKLIAMGGGPLFEEYSVHAKEVGILNEFTGPLQYELMVGKLCTCDAVINCIRLGAAQSITNKVGDYALSGLPVINTQENQEYRDLVTEYNCGINCECGNVVEVADAIIKLMSDVDMRKAMGTNARKLGNERFDRRISYPKIVELIERIYPNFVVR